MFVEIPYSTDRSYTSHILYSMYKRIDLEKIGWLMDLLKTHQSWGSCCWFWKWLDDCLVVNSFLRVLFRVCWKFEEEIDSFVSALVGAGTDLEGSGLFLFFAMQCLVSSILFGLGSCS